MANAVTQNSTRAKRFEASTGSRPLTTSPIAPLRGGSCARPRVFATSISRVNTRDHAHTTNVHTTWMTGQLQYIMPGSSAGAPPHASCTIPITTWLKPPQNRRNVASVVIVRLRRAPPNPYLKPSAGPFLRIMNTIFRINATMPIIKVSSSVTSIAI